MRKNRNHAPNEATPPEPVADKAPPIAADDDTTAAPAEAMDATLPPEEIIAGEIDAQHERLLRLQADFDNYRKRMVRERLDTIQNANERLLLDLLPVVDHMDMALKNAAHPKDNPFAEGFRMVRDQLMGVLERFNVQVIDAHGQPFDPNHHEAVAHAPSESFPENAVMEQLRKGYRLGDRLLRPAQVVVSSGTPSGDSAQPAEEE